MKITEIEKIPDWHYRGVDTIDDARLDYRNSTKFKKFSDSDFYYLNDTKEGRILIAVPNTGVEKYKTTHGLLIVGVLNIYKRKIKKNIYNMPVVQVSSIAVDETFRGQGIAGRLYDVVLKSGYILFSGDSQTSGGRAMWSNLYRRPGVEVTGWVKFHVKDIGYNIYSDDDFINFIEAQGGAYFGEGPTTYSGIAMFFEFEVEQLPTKAELEAVSKLSPIKVYDNKKENGDFVGLMARYIG
jgi:GNAT superfamily N-acetyltransferase